ncbi:hypothetical protein [Bacillus mycoides]|uniref:Helix-hairpin-helix domain-containing protein n=1 Tax=Bacillus mycoides TaxID=1405 RepID=A0A4V5TQN1_BACMY|nr:helix-hairpin-helix domain-containing protein [Bacillus mycoides]
MSKTERLFLDILKFLHQNRIYREKYPKTVQFVSTVVETFEQYYKRCVERAISQYGNSFNSVNQLLKVAKIGYGAYYQIKSFIDGNIKP